MFGQTRQILDRLAGIEARLAKIEQALHGQQQVTELRAELDAKREEIAALGEQGLHVVEMLDAARKEIARLKGEA